MKELLFILGIIVGLLISVINLTIIKKEIPEKVNRVFKNNKASIVDIRNPLDIDLNEETK